MERERRICGLFIGRLTNVHDVRYMIGRLLFFILKVNFTVVHEMNFHLLTEKI